MRRREFIAGLGGAAAGSALWRGTTWAQQAALPVIGILHILSPDGYSGLDAIRKGLSEASYAEGRNVAFEYRWAENRLDRLPAMADDLVRRRVDVIVALGGNPSALAAKAATTTIPIVFAAPTNPVEIGLVASLNRPGENLTGFPSFNDEVTAKRFAMLHDLTPKSAVIGVMSWTAGERVARIVQAAAATLGRPLKVLFADTESEVEAAFAALAELRVGAVLVNSSPVYLRWGQQIVALAARYGIPASYHRREFVEIGGMLSYGANLDDIYRQAGVYVGRILKGEKPGDLPVVQPAKFELAINLKTAKALGLDIPPTLLAIADEVIE